MNKILFLLLVASCNPITNSTKIDSIFKPGLPNQIDPATASSSYSSSSSTKLTAAGGFAKGSQVSGEFEISSNGNIIKGNQVKATIDFNSAEIR